LAARVALAVAVVVLFATAVYLIAGLPISALIP
jgi:hypothetical protein